MKKLVVGVLAFAMSMTQIAPMIAHADAAVGDATYTLGANLSSEQRQTILTELNYKDNEPIIEVTNAEEHKYLGGIIPAAQIGTRALSSSRIEVASPGTGVVVDTQKITWVTPEMYSNAMITAGLKDAKVSVTAPFPVSGTAALTGIMKAYETTTGQPIDEEKKEVANEEMVTTAKLGDQIGTDEANNLMANIKLKIAEEAPTTEAATEAVVQKVADELAITLTDEQVTQLAGLFSRMSAANVDWSQIKDQIQVSKDAWDTKFQELSEGFFSGIFSWFQDLWNGLVDWISGLFAGGSSEVPENTETPETTPPVDEQPPSDQQTDSSSNNDNVNGTKPDTPTMNTEDSTTDVSNGSSDVSDPDTGGDEASTPSTDTTTTDGANTDSSTTNSSTNENQ
ncbi:MAG: DUF1002 domain-containing protein [Bacilli bacterium]